MGEKGRVVGYLYLEPSSNSVAPLIQVGAEKVEHYLFLVFIDYLKTYTS